MIPSLLWLLAGAAWAEEEGEEPEAPPGAEADEAPAEEEEGEDPPELVLDDTISRYRLAFPVLVEQAIGSASKSVEMNWRKANAMVAATGSHPFELNNFDTLRAGGVVRAPFDQVLVEVGAAYVWVWDTPSTTQLALTPYRQPGRPPRVEFDLTVGFPVAEGVITTFPRLLPSAQIVFTPYIGLRYLLYPMSFDGMTPREIVAAVVSPGLTDDELENLEDRRLDAMELDPGRYGLMIGFGNEIYFKQALFLMPRAMFAVPLLAPASGSELRWWADLSLSLGVAF